MRRVGSGDGMGRDLNASAEHGDAAASEPATACLTPGGVPDKWKEHMNTQGPGRVLVSPKDRGIASKGRSDSRILGPSARRFLGQSGRTDNQRYTS